MIILQSATTFSTERNSHEHHCHPDLPVPPGAVSDGWHRLADDADDYVRCITWARFDTDRVGVAVDGCQFSDGLVDAVVSLYDVKELSAADARGWRRRCQRRPTNSTGSTRSGDALRAGACTLLTGCLWR